MNTQDNNKQSNEALQGWVVIAGKRYSIAPKIDTGSDIDAFMKNQAVEDQRFYAAKVAFKGPQLLNGLAPSYEELSHWVTMGPITRLTDYSFYPTEPNGALFRRIMADIEQSDKRRLAGTIDKPKGFSPMSKEMANMWMSSLEDAFFDTSKTPVDDATAMTFEKMHADMIELMKAFPPAVAFHPFVGYPGKFLPLANPKVDYDIPLFLPDDVMLNGGLGNLKIIFSKKRQPLPENGKYYIDMEMPIEDKRFDAFLNGPENKEKEPGNEK